MRGVCGNYHLKIDRDYGSLNIVHLEMLNVLVALCVFDPQWAKQKLLIKCDNDAVVKVLNSDHTQDPFLRACVICLFIWGFTSLSTLYRSYHDG